MRKINKNCNFSTVYKAWETAKEAAGENHGKYNSTKGEYYWDIAMNLYHCQRGVCAYTEMLICAPHYYAEGNWKDGRYINPDGNGNPQTGGQLEHFDRTLKSNKAWLWSNFFMAETNVNTKAKSVHDVDAILKPDEEGYDEFSLLEYNETLNIFIAKTTLPEAKQVRINKMIIALGINFSPVKEQRRIYLADKKKMLEFGIYTWANIEIEQFFTALEMIKRKT